MNNSTGKRSAEAFKLKPTMAFAGQAAAGAFVALAATGSVYAQGATGRRTGGLVPPDRAGRLHGQWPPTRNRSSSPASAAASRAPSR